MDDIYRVYKNMKFSKQVGNETQNKEEKYNIRKAKQTKQSWKCNFLICSSMDYRDFSVKSNVINSEIITFDFHCL